MKKISESEKRMLSRSINVLINDGIIARQNSLMPEAIKIYSKRINNGSTRPRAFMDTVDDITIEFNKLTSNKTGDWAKSLRNSTKTGYYLRWANILTKGIIVQMIFILYMVTANFPAINTICFTVAYSVAVQLGFAVVFVFIAKDKNYDTNSELTFYCTCQRDSLMMALSAPLFFILDRLNK